jgi:membrane-associated phospholipid phosphatase
VIGAALVLLQDKLVLHLKINAQGHPFIDAMASWLTHIGDGLFLLFMAVIFLFIRLKTALILFLSFIVSAGIVQLLKHTIFADMKRPYFYFENDSSFRVMEDFTYFTENSFPSGHATSCFVLFTIMAFHFQRNYLLQLVFVSAAVLIAFTRVYLSQHFMQDIIAGSIIGVIISQILWTYINPLFSQLDRPLFNRQH